MPETNSEIREHTTTFADRANRVFDKYDLTKITPNRDLIVNHAQGFVENYQVPESFLEDDINLGLILGCSQKLLENSDPIYRQRVEKFSLWLVEPVVPPGVIDVDGIWGSQPSSAELPRDEMDKYISEKTSPEATQEFIEKHQDQIQRCQESWFKKTGKRLQFKVNIVEDSPASFKDKVRGVGFIRPPKEGLTPEEDPVVELVLLKGVSAEKEDAIRHELYHIEDIGNFVRRGRDGSIFEFLDELHTEHAVGNYFPDKEGSPGYSHLKDFWAELSFMGDLDFNLIADRQKTLDTIAANFGLSGLVDFGMFMASTNGRLPIFETFYSDGNTVLMNLLLQKEKISLLKNGSFDPEQVSHGVDLLSQRLTPIQPGEYSRYISLYDFFPSQNGHIRGYNHEPNSTFTGTDRVDNQEAKELVSSYAKALAMAEIFYGDRAFLSETQYLSLLEAISRVPNTRSKPNFDLQTFIEYKVQKDIKYSPNPDEAKARNVAYQHLFYDLTNDFKRDEILLVIENPQVKDLIAQPLLHELFTLTQNVLDTGNNDFIYNYVRGFFRYSSNLDLRNYSQQAVIDHFPQLSPVFDTITQSFDSRKMSTFSV